MVLSVIIIEYCCMAEVFRCINSVIRYLTTLEYEIVVVSNSQYTKEELELYNDQMLRGKIISTEKNAGYAAGVNVGITNSVGEFIYVLNPDAILIDGGIRNIIKDMRNSEKWALAGPTVLNENGIVQPSCRCFPRISTALFTRTILGRFRFATREMNRYFMAGNNKTKRQSVDWISGGALVAKRSVIHKLGLMDERYFLYMEDVDWCRTAKKEGFDVRYCPESRLIHPGKHRSVNYSLSNLYHILLHVRSLCKYFLKWGLK